MLPYDGSKPIAIKCGRGGRLVLPGLERSVMGGLYRSPYREPYGKVTPGCSLSYDGLSALGWIETPPNKETDLQSTIATYGKTLQRCVDRVRTLDRCIATIRRAMVHYPSSTQLIAWLNWNRFQRDEFICLMDFYEARLASLHTQTIAHSKK